MCVQNNILSLEIGNWVDISNQIIENMYVLFNFLIRSFTSLLLEIYQQLNSVMYQELKEYGNQRLIFYLLFVLMTSELVKF